MSIKEYFGDWLKVINTKELNRVMGILVKLYKTKQVCPAQTSVFKAFNMCPYRDLKVVMLGLDPYPQKGIATGILFGNNKNTPEDKLSPSLKVVKEAVIDFGIPKNSCIFDPSLENWEKQGILMINSALTCELNKTGSHTMLWRPFISELLKNLSMYNNGLIYVLFGSQAQTFRPYINKYNHVFEVKHPAYYARTNTKMPNIFKQVNKISIGLNGTSIKWYDEY